MARTSESTYTYIQILYQIKRLNRFSVCTILFYLRSQVANQKGNMVYYIIFLRITPFLPNWFINIASPLVDVQIVPFFIGTFIGVAPPSILAIRAGISLQQLASANILFSWENILLLSGFALLSLMPVLLNAKLKSKFE